MSGARIVCLGGVLAIALQSFIVQGAAAQSYPDSIRQRRDSLPSAQFFSGSRDIPVMPGLVELPDRSFTFDKPEGDITEILAYPGKIDQGQILYYYGAVLPQFGWNRVSDMRGRFFRQNEALDISFVKEEGQFFVKFSIRPSR